MARKRVIIEGDMGNLRPARPHSLVDGEDDKRQGEPHAGAVGLRCAVHLGYVNGTVLAKHG